MRRLVLCAGLVVLMAAPITGPASAEEYGASSSDAYASLSLSPPSMSSIVVCHGFGCRDRTVIALTARDRARLAGLLNSGHSTPAAERAAIARAVAWFDRRVGPEAGTAHHVARAGHDNKMSDAVHQFDCIDASRNTTSLLRVLDELRLLKFHGVNETVARGAMIDGRWPHATAVVTDRASGTQWAVDSWTRAYGEQPEVKPLAKWLGEGGL